MKGKPEISDAKFAPLPTAGRRDRSLSSGAVIVAQTSSLLYRGFPIRRARVGQQPGRLEVGGTAGWKPALRGVAQTSSLLCRGFPIRSPERFATPSPRRLRTGCRFAFLALCFLALSAGAFVYETPTEFQTAGDFDGDGRTDVLLVDKATGGYRVGYQTAPGVLSWAATRASGIQNATGLSVGRLIATTRDAFVCTAPEANRLNLLDPSGPAVAPVPVSVFISSIGPNTVGAIDIGGAGNTALDDLFVGSIWNNATPTRFTSLRNTNGVNFGVLSDAAIASAIERANRVSLKVGTTDRLGVIFRGATDTFRAYDLSTGSVVQTLMQSLAAGSEYIFGRFSATNPLSQLVFYRPGTVQLIWHQVLESTPGNFSLGAANTFNLTNRILRVYVVPGGSNPRLLVVHATGQQADVFDFDGVTPPVLVQSFAAASGASFTGAALLGSGHFMLFSGEPGTGLSTRFQTWTFTGSGYTAGASGNLPYLGGVSAAGNVLLFRAEPFVTNQPGLVRVLNAGDWTSQFRATGAPPVVTVTAERYAGASDGLRNPTATALGQIPPTANFGLVNQYTNYISIFSLRAPAGDEVSEVLIAPEPGRYNSAIEMTLTPADPTHQAWFRLGAGPWTLYSAPVRLFTNVTVQFYGRPPTGLTKSAIRTANYSFTEPPSTLDSDNDGVPDFVELGRGLDPNGGPDSDDDGYSDLEELLRGSNPLSAASVPPGGARLEFNAAFDRAVTPRPYDGPADAPTCAATGTVLRVYAAAGGLLSVGSVTNVSIPGVLNPAARLTNIVVQPEDRLLVEATELHYDIVTANADKRLGRELVGLLPAPRFAPVAVNYTFGGGSLAAEANAWIAAASNAWAGATRPISKGDLTVRDTLTAALVERKIGQILVSRGLPWGTNITLFGFRPGDAGRTNVTRDLLLWLEQEPTNGVPAWRLSTLYQTISNLVETSSAAGVMNLRAVATEIFDICSTHNNAHPVRFTPPLDQLRRFLEVGNYDAEYSEFSVFHGIFASAFAGAQGLLAAVPPRPVTNVLLVATLPGGGSSPIQFTLYPGTTPVRLYKADGSPYDLPDSFAVLPGSLLQVRAFADLTPPPGGLALEVISVSLTSIPLASDSDLDGNLLVDTWERLFFGDTQDAFGDWDGDGYQNLQEMFEGSDPRDPLGRPAVPPVSFARPYLELLPDGTQIRLRFNWPGLYINRVVFGVKAAPDLHAPFADVPATGPVSVPLLPNTFELILPVPAATSHFYLVYLRLL